VTRPPAILA